MIESGMQFRHGNGQVCWPPEQCDTHKSMKGVMICDFVIKRGNRKLFFMEAKSSNPKHNLQPYIDEIAEKLENSVGFFYSHAAGRLQGQQAPLPATMKEADLLRTGVHQLLLIIRNAKKEWLTGVQEALAQNARIYKLKQIKRIQSVICLNEEMAREKQFIAGQ